MIQYVFAMGTLMAVYAGPQVQVDDLKRCYIDIKCEFDWRQYDVLVPALEGFHYRPGFWRGWRRSTNVEIAGQGQYRP